MTATSKNWHKTVLIANQLCYCNFVRGLLRTREKSVIDEDSVGECIKVYVQKKSHHENKLPRGSCGELNPIDLASSFMIIRIICVICEICGLNS